MRLSRPLIALSRGLAFLLCVCAATAASAQGADDPGAAPASGVAAKPGRKAQKPKQAATSDVLPCPRATWKDDPVCFGAQDADALPTPSTHGRETATRAKGSFQPAAAENVSVGVKWGASNDSTSHETTPLRSVGAARRTVDETDNWGGGGENTHIGAGVNLKF